MLVNHKHLKPGDQLLQFRPAAAKKHVDAEVVEAEAKAKARKQVVDRRNRAANPKHK